MTDLGMSFPIDRPVASLEAVIQTVITEAGERRHGQVVLEQVLHLVGPSPHLPGLVPP
jgi:hypothetical protein